MLGDEAAVVISMAGEGFVSEEAVASNFQQLQYVRMPLWMAVQRLWVGFLWRVGRRLIHSISPRLLSLSPVLCILLMEQHIVDRPPQAPEKGIKRGMAAHLLTDLVEQDTLLLCREVLPRA